jgi:hypothetical protein
MTSRLLSGRTLAGIAFACAVAVSAPLAASLLAVPAYAADEETKVRPEIGKPLQAAQAAIKDKKFGEALARLKEADAVANKTPYEQNVLDQLRVIAAIYSDEPATAAKSYDALVASNSLQPATKLQFIQGIASGYFKAKEYGAAITWIGRYFAAGGTDLNERSLLAQTYYLNNDFPNTTKASNEAIEAYDHAGQQAPETLYLLGTSAATKLNDKKAYAAALEKLVSVYPKQDYWLDLLHQTTGRPGFPDRLSLDVFRLQAAIGGLTTTGQYMDFAELAIQAGLSAEAKTVVDKGYAANLLGSGAEADRHGRLRDMAKRSLDSDQKTLAAGEAEAAKAPNGDPLVNFGLDYYGYGQYDKAISLMQAGIAKGGLKYPDDAKLHLGIALLAAGQKAKAIEAFKSIKSGDAVNDLARMWVIKATSHAAS